MLSDPDSYAHWVVGATRTRSADADWPAVGSTFHHTQGAAGIGLKDSTSVLACDPPRRLVMEVRIRPLMVGKVELRVAGHENGARVTMIEHPTGALLGRLHNPLLDRLIHVRNIESLRRLRKLAERRD
ncbi:MAG: SRPBCC family protein [Thermoleophilaceae bacterium]